jgi:hypothetical protein
MWKLMNKEVTGKDPDGDPYEYLLGFQSSGKKGLWQWVTVRNSLDKVTDEFTDEWKVTNWEPRKRQIPKAIALYLKTQGYVVPDWSAR